MVTKKKALTEAQKAKNVALRQQIKEIREFPRTNARTMSEFSEMLFKAFNKIIKLHNRLDEEKLMPLDGLEFIRLAYQRGQFHTLAEPKYRVISGTVRLTKASREGQGLSDQFRKFFPYFQMTGGGGSHYGNTWQEAYGFEIDLSKLTLMCKNATRLSKLQDLKFERDEKVTQLWSQAYAARKLKDPVLAAIPNQRTELKAQMAELQGKLQALDAQEQRISNEIQQAVEASIPDPYETEREDLENLKPFYG